MSIPLHTALTRSRITNDHALITPESHVQLSPPGWEKATVVYFISPQMGANFTMFMGTYEAGGSMKRNLGDNEILGYVLEGEGDLSTPQTSALAAGSFFFLPPNTEFTIKAKQQSRGLFLEKKFEPLAGGKTPPGNI